VPQQAVVRGPLDIGFAAQGVDAAAGHAHVAQQQLDDGHGTDVLGAGGVLGPAHGVHDGTGHATFTGGAVCIVDPLQVGLGSSRNLGNGLEIVSAVMFFQQLKDAALVLQRPVHFGYAVLVHLESPLALVVFTHGGALGILLVAGKKAVLESVFSADDEGRIGIQRHVLLAVQLVLQDVFDHPPEKSDVRT
jgi:hypothetical protein